MDGVIFERPNFWLDLHQMYGTLTEGVALADQYLSSDYLALVERVAQHLWKGRPTSVIDSLVEKRRYAPGIRSLMANIRRQNIRTAIVSSGPYELAARAQAELGFDEIRANKLHRANGKLTGKIDLQVDDTRKLDAGIEVCRKLGIRMNQVAFIGDSDSDAELAAEVGLGIAYGLGVDSPKLAKVCPIHIGPGKLETTLNSIATFSTLVVPSLKQ